MVDIAAALDRTVDTPAAIAEVPTKEKGGKHQISHTIPTIAAGDSVQLMMIVPTYSC